MNPADPGAGGGGGEGADRGGDTGPHPGGDQGADPAFGSRTPLPGNPHATADVRVAVIGLGLIGGSLARDLSRAGNTVLGADRDPRATRAAVAAAAVAEAVDLDGATALDADIVVLAVPVTAAPALLEQLAARIGGSTVLTDVASTKRSILSAAAAAGLGGRFVGSHPMAGAERSGWSVAREGLFRGARVWLCPGSAGAETVDRVARLWQRVGALPAEIPAADHDRLMAGVSHLPQAVASGLAGALAATGTPADALGPGGADTTRLAASDPDLWAGILLDNADELRRPLDALLDRLAELRGALDAGDAASVREWLRAGRDWRRGGMA